MLIAFLLLSSESYLSTYTLSQFQLSQGIFGPTEIRILLVIGTFALLRSPYSTVFHHRMLLFDLGGTIASVCMFTAAILLTIRHTAQLYREEPVVCRRLWFAGESSANLIGAMGMGVQLLPAATRIASALGVMQLRHYLFTSA